MPPYHCIYIIWPSSIHCGTTAAKYLKLYESEEKVTTERKTQHSNQALKNLMMYYYEVQQSSANSFDGR